MKKKAQHTYIHCLIRPNNRQLLILGFRLWIDCVCAHITRTKSTKFANIGQIVLVSQWGFSNEGNIFETLYWRMVPARKMMTMVSVCKLKSSLYIECRNVESYRFPSSQWNIANYNISAFGSMKSQFSTFWFQFGSDSFNLSTFYLWCKQLTLFWSLKIFVLLD